MNTAAIRILSIHLGFALVTGSWVVLQQKQITDGSLAYLFNLVYAVFAVLWGLLMIYTSKEWGWFRSLYGKAIIGFGCALVSWGIGGIIWGYYNFGGFTIGHFLNPQPIEEVPFPSWPDLGFAGFIPATLFGSYMLAKGVGISLLWKKRTGKIVLLAVPLIATAVTFFAYRDLRELDLRQTEDFLRVFLNYYYTVGGAFVAGFSAIIVILSPHYQHGKLRNAFYLLTMGIIVQYIADFAFTYRTYPGIETYYNGDISDYLYALSLYLIAIGTTKITLKK